MHVFSLGFVEKLRQLIKPHELEPRDPLVFAETNFPGQPAKSKNYFQGVQHSFAQCDYSRGPFQHITKSGEVYYGVPTHSNPMKIDHSSRPRAVMSAPSDG
jgi:hypothetical protein